MLVGRETNGKFIRESYWTNAKVRRPHKPMTVQTQLLLYSIPLIVTHFICLQYLLPVSETTSYWWFLQWAGTRKSIEPSYLPSCQVTGQFSTSAVLFLYYTRHSKSTSNRTLSTIYKDMLHFYPSKHFHCHINSSIEIVSRHNMGLLIGYQLCTISIIVWQFTVDVGVVSICSGHSMQGIGGWKVDLLLEQWKGSKQTFIVVYHKLLLYFSEISSLRWKLFQSKSIFLNQPHPWAIPEIFHFFSKAVLYQLCSCNGNSLLSFIM